MMAHSLISRIEAIWYGDSPVVWLLLPLSWLYRVVVYLRRQAYRIGLRKQVSLPVPVVVVGNITVGGTGKTPIVDWLVGRLKESGCRPGIVSRGYGGRRDTEGVLVTADSDPAEVGDEPVILARRTGCPVCVARDRVFAARKLVAQGVDVIVGDDGLQHYRMGRDVEIIVVDGERGLGNGHMLPAGPLREPAPRLMEADAVLINGTGAAALEGEHFACEDQGAISLDGQMHRALASFVGADVWAVAGVGNPARFYRMLDAAGITADPVPVPDHGRISLADLLAISRKPVLMTEKDAIKYRGDPVDDVWYVPIVVRLSSDRIENVLLPKILNRRR